MSKTAAAGSNQGGGSVQGCQMKQNSRCHLAGDNDRGGRDAFPWMLLYTAGSRMNCLKRGCFYVL